MLGASRQFPNLLLILLQPRAHVKQLTSNDNLQSSSD